MRRKDVLYRLYIYLLFIFNLTSCVYYGDIHGKSKLISINELNTRHIYLKESKTSANWWDKFQDPKLNQLIISALVDSPSTQIAEVRVRRAQAIIEGAAAPLWPAIDFNGYIQRQRFSEFGLVPPPFNGRIFNISDLGLNLTYDFDFWGKNRELLASRISEKCAAKADLAQARLIISAAVANTYFQLLSNQAAIKLAEKNAKLSQEIANIVVSRSRRGIESDVPVKTALANGQLANLAIERYKKAEKLSKNQLAILLGKNPFTTTIITHAFTYQKYMVSLPDNLTLNILAGRPDIFATKLRVEAAAHAINIAKTKFYPNISLMALFSYQSVQLNQLFDVGSQNNAITGAIDLPIFDAGLRRANLGVKYAEYDLAVNNYNQTLLTALREVADYQAILHSLSAELLSQEKALKATSYNYKLFLSRYNHGIIDYVQVLEIKQLLLQYRLKQIELQTQHLQSVVGILKSLGGNIMSKNLVNGS